MGFSISWLAFLGKSKNDILSDMHLVDTGIDDEALESPMSVASFPGNWTIIFLNKFDHPFAEGASLSLFSKGCKLIAGYVEEHVMFSSVTLYEDGKSIWSVSHESERGLYDVQLDGDVPPTFAEIKNRLTEEQKREDQEAAKVDIIFDVPLEFAASLCGFRHDRWRYDWGEPQFTALRDRSDLQ